MASIIKTTLAVTVPFDDEFSENEHVEDIVQTARRLFSTAAVEVVKVEHARNDEDRPEAF